MVGTTGSELVSFVPVLFVPLMLFVRDVVLSSVWITSFMDMVSDSDEWFCAGIVLFCGKTASVAFSVTGASCLLLPRYSPVIWYGAKRESYSLTSLSEPENRLFALFLMLFMYAPITTSELEESVPMVWFSIVPCMEIVDTPTSGIFDSCVPLT